MEACTWIWFMSAQSSDNSWACDKIFGTNFLTCFFTFLMAVVVDEGCIKRSWWLLCFLWQASVCLVFSTVVVWVVWIVPAQEIASWCSTVGLRNYFNSDFNEYLHFFLYFMDLVIADLTILKNNFTKNKRYLSLLIGKYCEMELCE